MKILIHSNAPWQATGYGKQTLLLTQRLVREGYEVVVSAISGLDGASIRWAVPGSGVEGSELVPPDYVTILPRGQFEFGVDTLPAYIEDESPDVVLLLMDVRMLGQAADAIRGICLARGAKLVAWVPSDSDPLSRPELGFLQASGARPVAMSRFAERLMRAEGLDATYIPHMVDTAVFSPPLTDTNVAFTTDGRGDSKRACRQFVGLPEDAFVVGMVAANMDAIRKGFSEQFEAFRRFHADNNRAHLMVHSVAQSSRGLDLIALAQGLGIPEDAISFANPLPQVIGRYDDVHMARVYRSMDILTACSYAEGFGVASIEAQACGTPVISSAFGAAGEVNSLGYTVSTDEFWNPVHRAWWGRPRIEAVEQGYDYLYAESLKPDAWRDRQETARRHAQGFDADRVFTTSWRPFLERIAS